MAKGEANLKLHDRVGFAPGSPGWTPHPLKRLMGGRLGDSAGNLRSDDESNSRIRNRYIEAFKYNTTVAA
jgi:hypothetical protein